MSLSQEERAIVVGPADTRPHRSPQPQGCRSDVVYQSNEEEMAPLIEKTRDLIERVKGKVK